MALHPRRRKELERKKDQIEAYLKGELLDGSGRSMKGFYRPDKVNLAGMHAELKHINKVLQANEIRKLTGRQKDSLAKKKDECKRKIQDCMRKYGLTREGLKDKNNGGKVLMYEKEMGRYIAELRQIEATLEPDDPTRWSVEYLRDSGKTGNIMVQT